MSGFRTAQGDPLMGFITSFASTGISHGLESAGVASLTKGVGGAAFNAGMGAAFSAMQGGDPWIGAAGSLIGYLANQDNFNFLKKSFTFTPNSIP